MTGNSPIYRIIRNTARVALQQVFSYEVVGDHHVPEHGPIILAINHRSYWDPPLVASALRRPVHFLAKAPLFDIPLLGSVLRQAGQIAVWRGQPNVKSVRRALGVLKRGGVIGIFPEGTCNSLGSLLPPWSGVGWFALASGAPVVPVAINGYKTLRRKSTYHLPKHVSVQFAPPMRFPAEHYTNRGRLFRTLVSHRIMDEIRMMIQTR